MSDQATSAAELKLAADFDTPSQEAWEKEVLKVLNRGRPEGKEIGIDQAYKRLTSTTVDGLTIDPLYTKDDAVEELGFPGVFPFVRGTTIRNGDMTAWHVAQLHEDPNVAATRQHVLTDLERGGTAVFLRIDPDALKPEDIPTVLADVLLDLAPVYLSSATQQLEAAKALAAYLNDSEKDNAGMTGNFGIDPIGAAALAGTDVDLGVLKEALEIAKPFPQMTPFVVDATIYHNAGAGDVHEVAYALAIGVEYVRALVDLGLTVDEAFSKIIFRVSTTTEQFPTIARLRSLRGRWSRIGEVLEVSESKRGATQHAITSQRVLTRDDAYVNMLRGTISSFAAAVGQAEIQTVLPFDHVWGLPNDFSRRIARNTQILLAEESNIGRVNDPAGGSWFVESLTNQISTEAWKVFQGLDGEGFIKALGDGTVKAQLDELNQARAKRLANRSLPITGVSMFPNYTEPPVERQPRPEALKLNGLTPVRDSQVYEDLRDRSNAAREAGNGPKVLLACLGARRDFGAREGFTAPLIQAGGIETVVAEGTEPADFARQLQEVDTKVAVLCSSAKVYASQGVAVANALREAGAETILVAGQINELGEGGEEVVDGNVFAGMDVVALLTNTLDQMGA